MKLTKQKNICVQNLATEIRFIVISTHHSSQYCSCANFCRSKFAIIVYTGVAGRMRAWHFLQVCLVKRLYRNFEISFILVSFR